MNSLPQSEYVAPKLPFEHSPLETQQSAQDDFMLDRTNWTFLNHGAFGAALRCGFERAAKWREYLELQPLRYFDRDLLPHLVESNRRMASFVNGDPRHLALVQNATTALNAVIEGYARKFGDDAFVMYYDVSYGSVKKMARHYCGSDRVLEIPFQEAHLPLVPRHGEEPQGAAFSDAFDRAVWKAKQGRPGHRLENALLILDQTTSNTAINVPVEYLAARAKEEGMLVLVDGAHGLLAQDVDLVRLSCAGVDFYVSNAHKWLSAPRGAAMLYCADEVLRDAVLRRPAVISHGVDDGFLSRFLWDGCRDYASQLALPVVIDHWTRQGLETSRERMRTTLNDAVGALTDMWHAPCRAEDIMESGVTIAPMSMHSPMALVRLPGGVCGDGEADRKTSSDAKAVQDFLFENRIEAPIKCINGVLYVRISCHVYNRTQEYEHLGEVMMSFPTQ